MTFSKEDMSYHVFIYLSVSRITHNILNGFIFRSFGQDNVGITELFSN